MYNRVNDEEYAVYLLVVEDGHGCSQVVAVALTAFERKSCLDSIIQIFQRKNESRITENIMIDKDLIELEVFKERFPWANVLYCRFHVIKTFKAMCPEGDKLIKEEILAILEKIVYAPTIDEFEKLYSKF